MQWLERCLESLEKSTVRPNTIIVDNGSMDGTVDYVKKLSLRFV